MSEYYKSKEHNETRKLDIIAVTFIFLLFIIFAFLMPVLVDIKTTDRFISISPKLTSDALKQC